MPELLYDPKFDLCRRYIEIARQKGKTWEDLPPAGMSPDKFDVWLQDQQEFSFWPSLGNTPAERAKSWSAIVVAKRVAEEASVSASRPLVVIGKEETESGIAAPQAAKTSWQLYKNHLLSRDWSVAAVESIESSSLRILKHMRRSTMGRKPVKGLVVGHVQSGKTATMAGLIAMAADHGWNLVIVLSGTLENLRIQTKDRIYNDLNHPGNLAWLAIDHPSGKSVTGQRAQNMQFGVSQTRHLIVTLKNSTRLQALIEWIKADAQSMKQMKILIIDDEADQAGINTADVSAEERSKINRQIIALSCLPAQNVNYVAFTATPAANFLNEGPGDALYPEDFIACLRQSDEHFGPLQIFGIPEQGYNPLGIVREITSEELTEIGDLHNDAGAAVPDSLVRSLLWFLCCVGAMRVLQVKKPVSMLIHTSQRQAHHENVGAAVRKFLALLAADEKEFLRRCQTVWDEVAADLTGEMFAERFPMYGRLTHLGAVPSFDTISKLLPEIIREVSAIRLDDTKTRTFHRGVHLCIDNCAKQVGDENEVRRLFYPDPAMKDPPDFASAFIVVGGSTLARGLTIENLVSTYFLRASAQADSLMQMGRWFGYRRGYELLPRIWMPADTRRKFEYITLAEEDLRDDLQKFMYAGVKPADVGPRIRVHPRVSWLRPTGKAKMQKALASSYDFSGISRQTTVFSVTAGYEDVHAANLTLTEEFLRRLPSKSDAGRRGARVWRTVSRAEVSAYLSRFSFCVNAQFFADMPAFLDWLEKASADNGFEEWNVVVAGNKPDDTNRWKLPDGSDVGRITRSRVPARSDPDQTVSVGVLRDPADLLGDAILEESEPIRQMGNINVADLRDKGGVGHVPQLLIYLIDKASKARDQRGVPDGETRADLAVKEHIVGISIWLPGSGDKKHSFVTHLTVEIPQALKTQADDLTDTAEGVAV